MRKKQRVCQVCGCSDMNKLEVHHILARSIYPELKGDERNLVVLCSKCHSYLHNVIMPEGMHNQCNFKSLVMLFAHKGNRKRWQCKEFMRDVLEKAKTGYYDDHLI